MRDQRNTPLESARASSLYLAQASAPWASGAPSKDTLPPAEIYLDANATTPPLPEVMDEVARTMAGAYGNPSSAHWNGSKARALLEDARDDVVGLLAGALSESVVFTSGGTEGNNAVVSSVLAGAGTFITSKVEHASILEPTRSRPGSSASIRFLDVSAEGLVNPTEVAEAVSSAVGPVYLSVQWANSETGVVQPMAAIVAHARQARPDTFIHSDVAQAIGRVVIDLNATAVDVVTFSGHKLHGPQGTGSGCGPTGRR